MIISKNLLFFFLLLVVVTAHSQTSTLTISPPVKQEHLSMPWRNIIAVGRANNLLRADILEHLAYAQKIMGYKYCRFHAIFDDEMDVVKRNASGKLVFQWHQVDKVYDALLRLGIKPFVELNPMPKVMASGTQDMFKYKMNVTPPKSYQEWEYLVYSFTEHMVERYGIDEVRTWYFEVWNEPNLSGFWGGTQDEYWKLYKASAIAVKRVDPKLRIGGPASSKGNWIKEIISYTTQNKIPLDFVSTHLYPQDEQVQYPDRKGSPHKVGDFFSYTVKEVEKWVKESSRPGLEIHWTEWNTQTAASAKQITWSDNIYVDNLYAASFIVRNCLELDKSTNSLAYWVVSDIFDEGGIPHAPFSNTYGLMSIHGIPKASFNAFRLLRKMTGTIQTVTNTLKYPEGAGAFAVKEAGVTKIILWNQNFVEKQIHSDWSGAFELPVEVDTLYNSIKMTIGLAQGSAWETWQVMGSPLNLSPTQFELLKAKSEPGFSQRSIVAKNKKVVVNFSLKPGEVQYIEVSAFGQAAIKRIVDPAELKRWEEAQSGLSNN